jgi:homoserine O-acetyltransferase
MPEVRINYLTIGAPSRDESGAVSNAVLLLHNTTGSAATWLAPNLGGELFGPGQPLDASRFYLVIPDCIGFGSSSKPSDGLRARFPNYRYADLVKANSRLVTEGLQIRHLRLVLGLSMGGMLTWMWGASYPDFQDALVPIASQPGPMSGRNWIQRRISIEAIRNDPGWNGGDYVEPPSRYVLTAPFSALMTQSVRRLQHSAPTREAADKLYRQLVERAQAGDANDRLYQLEASMDYDPRPGLSAIRSPLLAINFEDDELNPPALGTVEDAIERLPDARHVLIPGDASTFGHLSAQHAEIWNGHLRSFLKDLNHKHAS